MEFASQGCGSPWKFHMQRMGENCLSDYPWQLLPVTHWAEESWCQPPQRNAKYTPAKGKKKEGGEKQNIEGCRDRIGQDDRERKEITTGTETLLKHIDYRLRKKTKPQHVVEGYLWKEPQQTAQPKCHPWMGKSWIAVVQSRLLLWDLKSAVTAQQRTPPGELWQVPPLMPALGSTAICAGDWKWSGRILHNKL